MRDGYKVVLTADETMMSTYHGKLFLGFMSTAPKKGFLPPWVMFTFVLRPVPSDKTGRAILAPHGLRRVEAAILDSGLVSEDELITVHPENLRKVIGRNTKAILVSAIDPIGMGPASTTFAGWWGVKHYESYTKWRFRELICSDVIQEARRNGAVLIVGGPGAWQISEDVMYDYGIDIVVVGEGEKIIVDILRDVLEGWKPKKPLIVHTPRDKIPKASEIPLLKGGTIGGLIEVSRGCGRGCRFCSPTLRYLRHRRLEDIIADVKTNVKCGQKDICLHAEDVLQYGGTPFKKNPDAVIKLFKSVKNVEGVREVGVSHFALSSVVELEEVVEEISEILELDRHHWLGYQTGIETGSPRLMRIWMKYKPYPFKPEDWPNVVVQAFGISNDYYMIPCATLIVNLPGETEDDVMKTVELIDDLKDYRSLMVPLLYVPITGMPGKPMRLLEDATPAHWELYEAIWKHNMRWLKELALDYVAKSSIVLKIFVRLLVSHIVNYANKRAMKYFEEAKRKAKVKAEKLKVEKVIVR